MAIRTERYKDTQRAEFKEIFPSVIEIILKQVHNKKLPLKVTRRFKEVRNPPVILSPPRSKKPSIDQPPT